MTRRGTKASVDATGGIKTLKCIFLRCKLAFFFTTNEYENTYNTKLDQYEKE